MTLKYPADLDTHKNDFIKFRPYKYEINERLQQNGYDRGGHPPLPSSTGGPPAEDIVLYMPNSTPAAHYSQDVKYQTFPGPLGDLVKGALGMAGGDYSKGGFQGASSTFNEKLENLTSNADFGGAGYQFVLNKLTGFVGSDAATAIALGQGKAFNPNAEMIYKQPHHRKYEFSFDFIPKSREDAIMADKIIYNFKRWSAPYLAEGSQFMEIPCLWKITYHEATGKTYKRMNLFKPVMITNVAVQDNPMSDFHITIKDDTGHVPVHTALNLALQETMPPTRADHDWAVSAGYHRGY